MWLFYCIYTGKASDCERQIICWNCVFVRHIFFLIFHTLHHLSSLNTQYKCLDRWTMVYSQLSSMPIDVIFFVNRCKIKKEEVSHVLVCIDLKTKIHSFDHWQLCRQIQTYLFIKYKCKYSVHAKSLKKNVLIHHYYVFIPANNTCFLAE